MKADSARAVAWFYDSRFGRRTAKITQGQFVVVSGEDVAATTLGSCVAACIRDRSNGVGGMNHFLLPDSPGESPISSAARYGTHAMELLINALLKAGARRDDLEAKVFGAASLIGSDAMHIGARNAAFAEAFLTREGIPIVGSDLRGEVARNVYYFPDSGRALVRYLRGRSETVRQHDAQYRRILLEARVDGGADVF